MRILVQVFGATMALVFAVGGLAAVFLQHTGVPRRIIARVDVYGWPAIMFGLSCLALAAFFVLAFSLPKSFDDSFLKERGSVYALLLFGALLVVGFILAGLHLGANAI